MALIIILDNLQFNERKVVNEDGDGDPLTTPNVLDTWSDWSLWTDCSRSCGGGRKARGRRCLVDNKAELNCSGKVSEVEDCNTEIPCPGVCNSMIIINNDIY